jgi:hypothetical protein
MALPILDPTLQAAAAPVMDNEPTGGIAAITNQDGVTAPYRMTPGGPAVIDSITAPAIPVVGSQEDLNQKERASGADVLSGQAKAPMSFGQKLAAAADKLGVPAGPGGWARSIVAAGMAALGDVSAIGTVPEGAGALYGIGKVMAAQTARREEQRREAVKEKQQVFENARQMTADERADQAWEMQNKMQFLNLQQKRRDMDSSSRKEEDDLNQRMFKSALENDGVETDSNLTGSQIRDLTQKNGVDYFVGKTPYITGRAPVIGPDGKSFYKDGVLQTQPTYSFVQGGQPTKVDDKLEVDIKKYAPELKITAGTMLNKRAMENVQLAVMNGMHTQGSLNDAASKLGLSELQLKDIQEAPEKKAIGQQIAPLLAAHNNDVGETVDTLNRISNLTIPAGQPNAGQPTPDAQKATDLLRKFNQYYGSDIVANAVKSTAAMQLEKQKEAAKKAAAGVQDPRGNTDLHGQVYLDSLEEEAPGSAAKLRQMANGQMDLSSMQRIFTKNPGVIDELAIYDPSFSNPAIKGFLKTYNNYVAGPDKTSILAGSTAVDTLSRLVAAATPTALIPGTEANKRYEELLTVAATETQKFLTGGKSPTQQETREQEEKLRSRIPYAMGAAGRQLTQSIIDRYHGYQNDWVAAFPSKNWNYPMPTSWDKDTIDRANALASGKVAKLPPTRVQTQHINLGITTPGGEQAAPAQRQQPVNPY